MLIMKVRIRLGKGRPAVTLQVGEADTIATLKQTLLEGQDVDDRCELSLNGREPLDDSQTLCELGVVNGDLLFLLRDDATEPAAPALPGSSSGAPASLKEGRGQSTLCVKAETMDIEIESVEQQGAGARRLAPTTIATEEHIQESASVVTSAPVVGAVMSDGHYQELVDGHLDLSARSPTKPFDMLCLALHLLMLDHGFTAKETEASDVSPSAQAGVCKRRYSSSVGGAVEVVMVCVRMGPTLSVNGSAMSATPDLATAVSCTAQLNINEYTVSSTTHPCKRLKNTKQLSRLFRDSIAHKLLTDIRKSLGLPEVGTLVSLFPEMKLQVLKYLDVRSLLAMAGVCREFNILAQDKFVWRALVARDFGKALMHCDVAQKTWKEIYIDQCRLLRHRRQQQARWLEEETMPPWSHRPPEYGPPLVPGIVGGDYDRFPHPAYPRSHSDILRRLRGTSYNPLHDINPRRPEADLLHGPPFCPENLPFPVYPHSAAVPSSNWRAPSPGPFGRPGCRRHQFGGLRF